MERIYRKHKSNQLDIFLFTAQLMGGGEIEEIAQSGEKTIKLLVKELDNCPHILKTFYNFHCCRKINLQWKLYLVFGALFSSWRYA